jgi:hypothetical protein
MNMASTHVSSGELAPKTRALIIGACFVSVALAALGMESMWGSVEWIVASPTYGSGRNAFWYTNALALALAAAIVVAWLPRFEAPRLLRVAVLLPFIHIIAIAVAGWVWFVLREEFTAVWGSVRLPSITLPQLVAVAVAFGAVLALAVAIKRKHGEWAHAGVMLALSFLLLIGLWLPILSRLAIAPPGPSSMLEAFNEDFLVYGWNWSWSYSKRLVSRELFLLLAIVPPALVAIAFTALRFRSPRMFARFKTWPRTTVKLLFGAAVVAALTMPDEAWLLYLESSYIVLAAALLTISALITLTITTRLGSLAAHFWFRRMTKLEGVIAHDGDDDDAARFEITSWLRGPRLATRSFVVTTPHGNVPLDGVHVLAPIPVTTTNLGVGEHAGVLKPGDRVVIAGRTIKGADPFRSIGGTDIAVIAARGSRPYRFSDVTLVVWRPAVAYLAIMIAIALPYLSIVVT